MAEFEFVIAGAGLSGLTLALELATAFEHRPLLLVDPIAARVGVDDPADERLDRTIGFWCAGAPPFAELVTRSWSQLDTHDGAGPYTLELGALRYHALRWSSLRDHLLARLRARPQVTLRHGQVERFVEGDAGLRVVVDGEAHAARWGFDSRLAHEQLVRAPGHVLAWQRFCGLHIETAADRFDPQRASFMDLRASTNEQVAFLNVVPASCRSALVYRVELAPEPENPQLDAALERDLRERLGLRDWTVHGHERGALPLSDQRWARRVGDHVLRVGIAGGRLKPSSGYAFTRILADNQAILASLRERGHPFALPRERARFRCLDGVLLELLVERPTLGPQLFEGLFRECSTDTLFALLDERASLAQIIEVMLAMPHKLTLAGAGLRRALAWLRAPRVPVLSAAPEHAELGS